MSVIYLNQNNSKIETPSNIAMLKHLINPNWEVKQAFAGNINDLSLINGRTGIYLFMPIVCAFDQYILKVPANFNYQYITVFANMTNNVITLLLTIDKCTVNNTPQINLPVRYISNINISNGENFIKNTGDLILEARNSASAFSIDTSGLYTQTPVMPILQNYDMQSNNGNYKFYKNCELDDFTIVKV